MFLKSLATKVRPFKMVLSQANEYLNRTKSETLNEILALAGQYLIPQDEVKNVDAAWLNRFAEAASEARGEAIKKL